MDLDPLKIDRERKRARVRRGRRRGVRLVLVVLLLVVLAALGWLFRRPALRLLDSWRLARVRVAVVQEALPAALGAVSGTAANGYVVAARRAALSADFSGRVVEMKVREGSVVHKGDVVARLYAAEFEAAARGAEADLEAALEGAARSQTELESTRENLERLGFAVEAAGAAVDSAQAALDLAELTYARTAALSATEVSSRDELDRARANRRSAAAELERARAQLAEARAAEQAGRADVARSSAAGREAAARVTSAQAALEKASASLAKTVIRAPFDGVVILKDAEVGEVVSPFSQGGSNARGSLVTLVDFASLEVQADVPETTLREVHIGAAAQVFLDAWPEELYRGRVDRIWPTADRQKGTVEVRIVFEKPDERLRPEMGVRVVFLDREQPAAARPAVAEKVLLIPIEAIARIGGRPGVFALERDVVRWRPLELGAQRAGRAVVRSGLAAGERIVIKPPPALEDGERVLIEEG